MEGMFKFTSHRSGMLVEFNSLRRSNVHVDVTLCCSDGAKVSAHKVVLSACSSLFNGIFRDNIPCCCEHSVVLLQDVASADLIAMMELMYLGEATVIESQLVSFLSLAKLLNLHGFAINNTCSTSAAVTWLSTNPQAIQQDDVLVEEVISIPTNNVTQEPSIRDGSLSLRAKKKKNQSHKSSSGSLKNFQKSTGKVAESVYQKSTPSQLSQSAVTKEIIINLDSDDTDEEPDNEMRNEFQPVSSCVNELLVVDTTTEEVSELLLFHSSLPSLQTGEQDIHEDHGDEMQVAAPPEPVPAEVRPLQEVSSSSPGAPARIVRPARRLMVIKRGSWYHCSLCTNYFKTEARCRAHCKTRHQDQKKIICHICKSVYSSNHSLQRHMTKHTAKFKCSICGVAYDRMSRLKSHHAAHHLKM